MQSAAQNFLHGEAKVSSWNFLEVDFFGGGGGRCQFKAFAINGPNSRNIKWQGSIFNYQVMLLGMLQITKPKTNIWKLEDNILGWRDLAIE